MVIAALPAPPPVERYWHDDSVGGRCGDQRRPQWSDRARDVTRAGKFEAANRRRERALELPRRYDSLER